MVTVKRLLTNVLKHFSIKYLFLKEIQNAEKKRSSNCWKETSDHYFT